MPYPTSYSKVLPPIYQPIYLSFTLKTTVPYSQTPLAESAHNKHTANLAFVNYHLSSLDKETCHLHDFAYFKHVSPLNVLKHRSIVFSEYEMGSEAGATPSQTRTNLTPWLRSIAQLLVNRRDR